ncbi:MFS transporter [Loktanella sp. DSM 29012]|uniref:MFS transporter n=1 Tax=Loktanella sp. DSM 29012 TaxID=1881056 RepID=UPI000A8F3F62|nr:MFS transporter [Loktanella sp. DSM 29012]
MPDFARDGRRGWILAAGVLASSMGFIDGTVVSIAIPAIRASLGATLDQATWINNAYMLTLSALILTGGAFGDRFGLARVFSLGVGLFLMTSLLCAVAPTPDLLIIARLAQGVGAALMVPGSLAMISRAYPREERGRAIGIWAAASGLTTAAGPIVGGLLLSSGAPEAWRGIFAINLPLGIATLFLVWRAVNADPRRQGEPVDIAGALLAITGLGLLAWTLTHLEGSNDTRLTVVTGVAGCLVLAVFLFQQRRAAAPMMPLWMFRNRTFSAANASTFLLYFGMSAILFFLPMLTVAGWGLTAFQTIFAFGPITVFIAAFSTRFGKMADQHGAGPLITGGSALVAIGYAGLALVIPSQNFWLGVLPTMAVVGLGMSMVVAPLSASIMGAAGPGRDGIASGINNAVSRIAGLIAVAAMSSVVAIGYAINGGPASFGEVSTLPGHLDAMNSGFAVIAWGSSGLAALSAIIAALLVRR